MLTTITFPFGPMYEHDYSGSTEYDYSIFVMPPLAFIHLRISVSGLRSQYTASPGTRSGLYLV